MADMEKSGFQRLLDDHASGLNVEHSIEMFSYMGKSEVWKTFQKIKVDGDVAPYVVCNHCGIAVKYTPSDGTGGMKKHVHHVRPSTSSESSVQLKISGFTSCSPVACRKAKKEVTSASVKFCAKDIRPFTCVEGDGFKELASAFVHIGAAYGKLPIDQILPTRQTIANNVNEEYKTVKKHVKEELEGVSRDLIQDALFSNKCRECE